MMCLTLTVHQKEMEFTEKGNQWVRLRHADLALIIRKNTKSSSRAFIPLHTVCYSRKGIKSDLYVKSLSLFFLFHSSVFI